MVRGFICETAILPPFIGKLPVLAAGILYLLKTGLRFSRNAVTPSRPFG